MKQCQGGGVVKVGIDGVSELQEVLDHLGKKQPNLTFEHLFWQAIGLDCPGNAA